MMLFWVHWFGSYRLGDISSRAVIPQVTLSVVDIMISNVETRTHKKRFQSDNCKPGYFI